MTTTKDEAISKLRAIEDGTLCHADEKKAAGEVADWLAATSHIAPDAGVVATVIKKGADRTWMSENLGNLPDGTYSLYLAPDAAVASNEMARQAEFTKAYEKLICGAISSQEFFNLGYESGRAVAPDAAAIQAEPADLRALTIHIQNAYVGHTGEHLDTGPADAIARAVQCIASPAIAPEASELPPIKTWQERTRNAFDATPDGNIEHAMCAEIDDLRAAIAMHQAAAAKPDTREGFALVPLRLTAAMTRVMDEEGWAWEDLLAAAEAITEAQYNDIASNPDLVSILSKAAAEPVPTDEAAKSAYIKLTNSAQPTDSGGAIYIATQEMMRAFDAHFAAAKPPASQSASEAVGVPTDQANVMPPFAAPASQHDESSVAVVVAALEWIITVSECVKRQADNSGKTPYSDWASACADLAEARSRAESAISSYRGNHQPAPDQQGLSSRLRAGATARFGSESANVMIAAADEIDRLAEVLASGFREGRNANDSNTNFAAPAAPTDAKLTYSSTQATMCAGCGKHKHTPLRIDAMGGYVCLTCIDNKLGSMLGEFGYPDDPAAQSVRDALEQAAKICDAISDEYESNGMAWDDGASFATERAAKAIRALIQSPQAPKTEGKGDA